MAYQKYTGLTSPEAILEKVSAFALANGWTILANCIADLPVDGSSPTSDGVVLALKSPGDEVFALLRSANGRRIFDSQGTAGSMQGIGLTCADAYTPNPASGLWFDQPNAPLSYASQKVIGAGIPVERGASHTLYVNTFLDPAPVLVISVEKDGVFQHLAFGCLEKIGAWDGGAIFSGSRNSFNMFTAGYSAAFLEAGSKPLFGMTAEANTFLRIDMDAAPLRLPNVLWASAGNAGGQAYTGKQMALPVRTADVAELVKVPDYYLLQSKTTTDPGRDVNTLNCITVNLNQIAYVIRDPDALKNFSPVGYIPGVYYISLRNVAPGQLYEIEFPKSGRQHQVFPYTRRRGVYGFDGFSVAQ